MSCPEKFDPECEKPGRTHTCDLAGDHQGLHHCPTCGRDWLRAKVASDG